MRVVLQLPTGQIKMQLGNNISVRTVVTVATPHGSDKNATHGHDVLIIIFYVLQLPTGQIKMQQVWKIC